MKKRQPFKIRRKSSSVVFITKLEASDEYFEENHSSYVIVDLKQDLPLLRKAVETLQEEPRFEKVSFICYNAFVLPAELKNAMSDYSDELLYEKIYGKGKSGIMPILMPDTSGCYRLTLTYATVLRLGESEQFELYYEGFVETQGRIHVQSAYIDPLPLLDNASVKNPVLKQNLVKNHELI